MFKNKPAASTVETANPKDNQTQLAENSIPVTNEDSKVSVESVPILMYHYIRVVTDTNDTLGANLSVSPNIFSRQLDYLVANNYQTITLTQLRDGFAGSYKIDKTKKPIVITFDDGYDDAYTQAYPILKSHNMIGIFYIISGQIGQSERMTSQQIIDLDKNGMIIGSHTESHLDLTSVTSAELNNQLSDSKKTLEQLLKHQVSDFCYPAGKYNDGVALKVDDSGYSTAVTTKNGVANNDSDLFELPRIRMQNSTDLSKVLN